MAWTDPAADERVLAYLQRMNQRSTEAAAALDAAVPWRYVNYATVGMDVYGGYGEANAARLRALQQQVDPQGIFTSTGLFPGGFKLL